MAAAPAEAAGLSTTRPWFQTKDMGWRWGKPVTWQGWTVYAIVGTVVMGLGHYFPPRQVPGQFIGLALVACAVFVVACWAKGDRRQRR